MKGFSGHTSYYINVGQTIGIIGGLVLGFKALRVEEAKAGIQRRPLKDVLVDDVRRVQRWWSDNFGPTKMYTHH